MFSRHSNTTITRDEWIVSWFSLLWFDLRMGHLPCQYIFHSNVGTRQVLSTSCFCMWNKLNYDLCVLYSTTTARIWKGLTRRVSVSCFRSATHSSSSRLSRSGSQCQWATMCLSLCSGSHAKCHAIWATTDTNKSYISTVFWISYCIRVLYIVWTFCFWCWVFQ